MGYEKDELYDEAVQLILGYGKPSVSLLQRKLRIGFIRAHGLLADMETAGIVSPADILGQRTLLQRANR